LLTPIEKAAFGILLLGFTAYCLKRVFLLAALLRAAKPDPDRRTENLYSNITAMISDVFLQRRVLRKPVTGMLHLLIVWGFFVFAVNTVNHFAGAFIPDFHLLGDTRIADYYTALADVFALLILAGVIGLAIRRYVLRPASLTPGSVESAIVLFLIGGAMTAYLFANATEIALADGKEVGFHVVANSLAKPFTGMDRMSLLVIAHIAWWCDALMHLMLIVLLVIPTKHLHLVAGPLNLIFKRTRPRGQMRKLDLEDEAAETFGVSKIEEFTWKQNLDLYACIECGRCSDYCPTATSGKALNPKALIVGLKSHLLAVGPPYLLSDDKGKASAERPALIGGAVTKEALWACTTCGSCVEHCPMSIEHVDKITDMRTYLTLVESDFPQEATVTLRNMEVTGNPWGFAPAERAKWSEGRSGSYDDRSKKVSLAMARLLQAAGVDFAILGKEERCNCESARRLGNEYLFQTVTSEIIETLGRYEFNRILVTCPHCYNTFKNDYPLFNAAYDVVHHAQFIQELVASKQLALSVSQRQDSIVYHDSCYLGRYNGIYEAPRKVLESAGCSLVSVPRERERGFCCGAGGGRMWLEEAGTSIAGIRAEELLATGAARIAAACPFCITMLTDGVKELEAPVPVLDIAEIVVERLA